MDSCNHDLSERETACADGMCHSGMCPLCLAAELAALRKLMDECVEAGKLVRKNYGGWYIDNVDAALDAIATHARALSESPQTESSDETP